MVRRNDITTQVDKFIGSKLHNLRSQRISRESFAARIGVSSQQLSKYESGTNRISASRLYLIANSLDTTPATFYEGLEKYLKSGA